MPESLDRRLSTALHALDGKGVVSVYLFGSHAEDRAHPRRGDRFEDYIEAVRSLGRDHRFAPELVSRLERLPGFRNVVIHEHVALDLDRVVEALDDLEPIERFFEAVRTLIAADEA